MSETGKQRQSRIELGYYRTPDALSRWRGRLTLLALLIAGAWVVAAPVWEGHRAGGVRFFQQDRLASKGPLARPHAMWESNCQACHTPFTAINGTQWSPFPGKDRHAGDDRCQTCHAGPTHHASQRAEDVPSCAECHRDHRGHDASLLAMDDSACTSCHRNLSGHRKEAAGPMLTAETVTQFDADPDHHPKFTPPSGVPGPDSGRIKFSHARHMARGLTMEKDGIPFTFASLDKADRARYGWSAGRDRDAIQLQCQMCHRLDDAEDGARRAGIAGIPVIARAAGALMLPITSENDCRACHPLRFEPKDPKRQVRHGLKPVDVLDELRLFYTAQAANDDPELLRRFVPPRPMPHRPVTEESARAKKAAADKTLTALRLLFGSAIDEDVRRRLGLPLGRGGCVECHELTPKSRPLVNLDAAANLEIKPVIVRSLWYESATFNHATHRALECAACHAGAAESKDQAGHLLPDIGKCVGCHTPVTTQGGRPMGGAGVSCVECHRYHNGDRPAQGIGARARRGTAEMTLDQYLSGGPPRGR